MSPVIIDPLDGLRRELEIGLALTSCRSAAAAAAKALSAILDDEGVVPVRVAGVAPVDGHLRITLAITLGSIDEIKSAQGPSREALVLVRRIVDDLAAYDPAFTRLPDPASAEARLGERLMDRTEDFVPLIQQLALAG